MSAPFLKIHQSDNVSVALEDLNKGLEVQNGSRSFPLIESIPAKHKFAVSKIAKGKKVIMYGVTVGTAKSDIPRGGLLSTENIEHAVEDYTVKGKKVTWDPPDISKWEKKVFKGYHRNNGKVGTANYWLVIPLVFCENRNINVIREALVDSLGYQTEKYYNVNTYALIEKYQLGASSEELLTTDVFISTEDLMKKRVFPNVDGIKFLNHEGGCGGDREDSLVLVNLLADYIYHPNVAGATILSLGCQHAQIELMQEALNKIDPDFDKPVYFLEQQQMRSERQLISEAVKKTFVGLVEANRITRKGAPLSELCVGLECGGSDGFSGITANPALGHTSDLLVALGGSAILSEFPELNGVEQELINRCTDRKNAKKFYELMNRYKERAELAGSGFYANPSYGNIKDGLITDAIKSAGAAKKGGTSPVNDVLDYTEVVKNPGLNLLCTPGNDVESTTGLAASGANIICFTTGLGTPTGNPVAPTIKISSNSDLYKRMHDVIDIDAGTILSGRDTIESKGEEILDHIVSVASGEKIPRSVRLGQDDFIPWKRGISL